MIFSMGLVNPMSRRGDGEGRGDGRLVSQINGSAKHRSNQPYEPRTAPKVEDNLPLEEIGALFHEIARQNLGLRVKAGSGCMLAGFPPLRQAKRCLRSLERHPA